MTLLARKDGLSIEDFRAHWAGLHAQLALRMSGIGRYVQNRVEERLWHTGSAPAFDVDGIVELFFTDAKAMRLAQASDIGTKLIPEDEPRFLKGWTLCVVESEGDESAGRGVKVLAPFRAPADAREALARTLASAAADLGARFAVDWTTSTASRQRLWSEPHPPTGFLSLRLDSEAQAHAAFAPASPLRRAIESHASDAVAWRVDVLAIR